MVWGNAGHRLQVLASNGVLLEMRKGLQRWEMDQMTEQDFHNKIFPDHSGLQGHECANLSGAYICQDCDEFERMCFCPDDKPRLNEELRVYEEMSKEDTHGS